MQFPNEASFPATGETSILYVDTSDDSLHYWNGSIYRESSGGGGGGPTALTGDVTGSGSGGGVSFFTGAIGSASTNITSDPNIIIDSSSNLGVGNQNPQARLHVTSVVNDSVKIQNNQYYNYIEFENSFGPNFGPKIGQAGGEFHILTRNNSIPNIQTYTFGPDGDFGINNNVPTENLDVKDYSASLKLTATGPAASEIRISADGISSGVNINTSSDINVRNATNTELLKINNSNSIGQLQLRQYGAGVKTGTATYNLAVDGLGNVIEVAAGGSSLPTKTVDTFTGSGQSFIDLTVEASSVNYIDMYIDGVYQAKATYTIATPGGTAISRLTLVSGTFPTGVSIETVTTT